MRRSLFRQISVYFLVVIIFTLSAVGIFSYLESSRAIDEQVEKYITQVINTAAVQTEDHLKTYERLSNSILSQEVVKKFLEIDPTDSYEYYHYSNQIRKDVFQKSFITYPSPLITYPSQLSMIYIIGYHGRGVFGDNLSLPSFSIDPSERLTELIENTPNTGEIAILDTSLLERDHNKYITVARKIRGYSSYDMKGVLAIEFNETQLSSLWSQVDLGESGFFIILDQNKNVIYAPENEMIDQIMESDVPSRIVDYGDSRIIRKIGNKQTMFVSRKSDYSGWYLAVSMPLTELREPISSIRSTTITVGIVVLVIALFLALRFGNSIVKPIRELKEGMRETEKGNWTHIPSDTRVDEIGGLIHSYNLMVSRLSEMIDQVYHAELKNHRTQLELQNIQLERQRAEFQALQLQINPHFLYNTLETINCYAIVQDSDDISEIVEAMAFMLRYSIQTNLEEITIANELNHVRNYMIILKHRIQREFEIDVVMPPELLLDKMVRLTLQPVVENVFHHAFPDGIEDHHTIRIDAKHEGDNLLVIVEDNGIGMQEDVLQALRNRLKLNRLDDQDEKIAFRRSGIGIINVHRRIQMVFGNDYGVQVESKLHEGTRVIMTLPRQTHNHIKTILERSNIDEH